VSNPNSTVLGPGTRRSSQHVWRLRLNRAWNRVLETSLASAYSILGGLVALGLTLELSVERAIRGPMILSRVLAGSDGGLSFTRASLICSSVGLAAFLGYLVGRGQDRAQRLSFTDPLTGLYNRRYFGERMKADLTRARLTGGSICVLCIDLDHLKRINDGFGHSAGDAALVAVATTISKNLRCTDVVARFGGDEFVVLLPDTSVSEASGLSERIVSQVARLSVGAAGRIGVSIGIAAVNEANSKGVLAAADEALYLAKATGGGHGVVASSLPPVRRTRCFVTMNDPIFSSYHPAPPANPSESTSMQKYTLPELPFDYSALEPHISGRSMELHHSQHHAAHVRHANQTLEALAEARDQEKQDRISYLERALAFHVSGHVLHSIFWQGLAPKAGGRPEGELALQLDHDFESFDGFKKQMTAIAGSITESGWSALVWDPQAKRLVITQVYEHQSNLARVGIPVVVVDAWEHAYYLQYENRKLDFFDAVSNLWSWPDISSRFEWARKAPLPLQADGALTWS
jgi:Fe-Mn family superoxide dismutase